jgi:phosphate/sulfate permease
VRREDLRALPIPIAVALAIVLIYFVASGNWTNLGNPIASAVAIVAGVIGFGAGVAVDRRPWQRRRTQD